MEATELVARWSAAGYDTAAIRDTDGTVYPCHASDIPDGAIDAYVPMSSPSALRAIEGSMAAGYHYTD